MMRGSRVEVTLSTLRQFASADRLVWKVPKASQRNSADALAKLHVFE
jgi:hypothetical protein